MRIKDVVIRKVRGEALVISARDMKGHLQTHFYYLLLELVNLGKEM